MSLTDPVADFLARIRNAIRARHQKLDVPASKLKTEIARILKEEGYISNYKTQEEDGKQILRVYLKYGGAEAAIRDLARISRPGCRVYIGRDEILVTIDHEGGAVVPADPIVVLGVGLGGIADGLDDLETRVQRFSFPATFRFRIRQIMSTAICAAARAVISAWSNGGDTSTTSMPQMSRSPKPRSIASACALERPPATGVPVPGAKAGSRQSMSKVRYAV